VPVVAGENGRRPAGVIPYRDDDAVDRCTKMADVTDNDCSIGSNQDGSRTGYDAAEGASQMADWLIRRLSAIEYWPAIESITGQEFYLNTVLGAGTSARPKECLPCQQRYSRRHQKSGDPAAAIHFFMQEDFRGEGVTDEGE
jgi:hypothetical protein